jgi:uncharacterized protein (DUF983 family)
VPGATAGTWVQDRRAPAEDPGVGVDLGTPPGATACLACGAALRPAAPWCTLCFADLRAAASPAASLPGPSAAPAAVVGDGPSWPCSRCQAANPYQRDDCGICGARFLAAVRDDEAPLLVLPGVGDLSRLGRAQRLLLAVGVVLAVVVPLAVLTLLLSHRLPGSGPGGAPAPVATSVPASPAAP